MKIGFDAKRAFNNKTGLGNYARLVLKTIIERYPQHEYYLFTTKINSEFTNLFAEYNQVKIVLPQTNFQKKYKWFWRVFTIGKIVNKLELDIFHGLSNEIPFGINQAKTKLVVTIHDLIFLRYPEYYNFIDAFIYKLKFKSACTKSDLILAASQQTKNDIINFFKINETKIKVLYQDCSDSFNIKYDVIKLNEIRSKYNLPNHFILSVGTIETRKNQLTILKALEKLNNEWNLVLIGKRTDYANELIAFAKKNNLTDRLQIISNVDANDLPLIYQCCKLFVYISEFEGFGIPVLEAMKSEVPIITSNKSSLPEVIGPDGICIFPYDSEAIVQFVNNQLSNVKYIQQMVETQRKRTLLFNKEFLTDELINHYKNLL